MKCVEPYCSAERYGRQERCEKHYKRHRNLNRKRLRKIPKAPEHKAGMFDLSRCGAVGWDAKR